MTGGCTPIALYAVSFSSKEGRFVSKCDPVAAKTARPGFHSYHRRNRGSKTFI